MATMPNPLEDAQQDFQFPQREAAFFYGLFLRGHSAEELRRDIAVPAPVLAKWDKETVREPHAAAAAGARGAVSPARPGDFRELDRARFRETKTSVVEKPPLGFDRLPRLNVFRRVDSAVPLV